jgi:hypothetical protein
MRGGECAQLELAHGKLTCRLGFCVQPIEYWQGVMPLAGEQLQCTNNACCACRAAYISACSSRLIVI